MQCHRAFTNQTGLFPCKVLCRTGVIKQMQEEKKISVLTFTDPVLTVALTLWKNSCNWCSWFCWLLISSFSKEEFGRKTENQNPELPIQPCYGHGRKKLPMGMSLITVNRYCRLLLEREVAKDEDSLTNFVYQETKEISFYIMLTFNWCLWEKKRMSIQLLRNIIRLSKYST